MAPSWQGRGVGTVLLASRIDAVRDRLHLETWNAANLAFYGRFGFEVAATDCPLGVGGPLRWTLRAGLGTSTADRGGPSGSAPNRSPDGGHR